MRGKAKMISPHIEKSNLVSQTKSLRSCAHRKRLNHNPNCSSILTHLTRSVTSAIPDYHLCLCYQMGCVTILSFCKMLRVSAPFWGMPVAPTTEIAASECVSQVDPKTLRCRETAGWCRYFICQHSVH